MFGIHTVVLEGFSTPIFRDVSCQKPKLNGFVLYTEAFNSPKIAHATSVSSCRSDLRIATKHNDSRESKSRNQEINGMNAI